MIMIDYPKIWITLIVLFMIGFLIYKVAKGRRNRILNSHKKIIELEVRINKLEEKK